MTLQNEDSQGPFQTQDLKLTLEGKLMEGGSIEYKTLVRALTGTAGALDEISKLTNFRQGLSYRVTPPKEKCFEIVLQSIVVIGNGIPLLSGAGNVKDLVSFFIEYLKLKAAAQGKPLSREDIQANGNRGVIIKGNNNIVFNIPPEFAVAALSSSTLNRKIDEAVTAISKDASVDSLKYSLPGESKGEIAIDKKEVEYFKYSEETRQEEDQLVGYVREIDNTDFKGNLNVFEGSKVRVIKFELDIKDISRLEEVVSNLCIAEAKKARVSLIGEKILSKTGQIKLVKVYDIKIIDESLDI